VRDFDWIADRLASERWLVVADWLEPALQQALLDVTQSRRAAGELQGARIGRGDGLRSEADVRGDAIQWLQRDDPAECVAMLLDRLNQLREALNQRLYLGRPCKIHSATPWATANRHRLPRPGSIPRRPCNSRSAAAVSC
jgi:hypothetical protein